MTAAPVGATRMRLGMQAPTRALRPPARCTARRFASGTATAASSPSPSSASAGNLERLDQICKALCPNTEASLYTVSPDAGIETAVSPDGTQYTALPAAFRFQKTYDPTCSCKPANKSWAEALADAEALLEKTRAMWL